MTYDKIHSYNSPINKGFFDVHDNFIKCGWKIRNNTETLLSYVKTIHVLDEFILSVDKDKIYAIIPIPNSSYSYKTYFKNYFEASEYIISRLYDYEQANKNITQTN